MFYSMCYLLRTKTRGDTLILFHFFPSYSGALDFARQFLVWEQRRSRYWDGTLLEWSGIFTSGHISTLCIDKSKTSEGEAKRRCGKGKKWEKKQKLWNGWWNCKDLFYLFPLVLGRDNWHNGEGSGTPLQYSCLENPMDGGAWWAAVQGITKSPTWLSDFTFAFHFHALEKEMATHSSVLAWRIPGAGEPGGLPSMELHRVGHNWSNLAAAAAIDIN